MFMKNGDSDSGGVFVSSCFTFSQELLKLLIVLYILQPDYKKIAQYCNIWRNYNDIDDSWDSVKQIIKFYGDDNSSFSKVAAPGSFNDPDMVSCLYS